MLYRFIPYLVFTFLLGSTLVHGQTEALSIIRIASPTEDIEVLGEIIERGACLSEPSSIDQTLRRNAIELLILCRAIKLAHPNVQIRMVRSANYTRSMRIVKEGRADIVAESVWQSDADKEIFQVSSPVLRKGRFEKGVYTRIDHAMRELGSNKLELHRFRGVMTRNWTYDWNLMKTLTPVVFPAMDTASTHKIINRGSADFTLSEFPANDDLSVECENELIYPVFGVKVAMPGSRHFVISKNVENSDAILALVNAGLAQLHQAGKIDELYKEIGFINDRTENWLVLNASGIE